MSLRRSMLSVLDSVSSYDADAQAFITASGISGTNATAINTLVLSLKSASLWTKLKAVYPMVGGNATAHKFNLKDPRDLDVAFRLTFAGGWTHSSTGALPNGTNAYADTYLNSLSGLNNNSLHLSYYSRTNANGAQVEIGVQTSSGYSILEIRTSGTTYYLVNVNSVGGAFAADSNSAAFYLGNRISISTVNGFRNSTKVLGNTASAISVLNTTTMYLGAMHNIGGVGQYYSTKECAFSSVGDGLSDTDSVAYYNAIQSFQTTLGRQV